MADEENLAPYVIPFRQSLQRVADALNEYRGFNNLQPVVRDRKLNFNAYKRACHLMKVGIDDHGEYEDTALWRVNNNQTVDAIDLVRQWPSIKDDPADYLIPWVNDPLTRTVLLGDFSLMGIAGDIQEQSGKLKIILVLVMTNHMPSPHDPH